MEGPTIVAHSLTTRQRMEPSSDTFVAHTLRGGGFDASEDGTGRGTPLVAVHATQTPIVGEQVPALGASAQIGVCVPLQEVTSPREKAQNGIGIGGDGDPMFTLERSHEHAVAYQCHGNNVGPMGTVRRGDGGVTSGVPFLAFYEAQITHPENRTNPKPGDPAPTMNDSARVSVAVQESQSGLRESETAGTLRADASRSAAAVRTRMLVRRLLPVETERLQGLPPNWTLVPYRGKPAADGPRYRAVGNGFAVPVVAYIARNIAKVEAMG